MIDLNADLGEGLDDEPLLPFLTSANVACGAHAGSPAIMDRTVALLLERGIRIGAHPGYADRGNFGRNEVELDSAQVHQLISSQLELLDEIVRRRGGRLSHVKAHGALYNRAARDRALAGAIARAVRAHAADLKLFGLAGSVQLDAARDAGLLPVAEAFADRRYLASGALVPRSQPGAILHHPEDAAAQALSIARDGFALAADGTRVAIAAQTLCLHGDTPGAAAIAQAIHARLESAGVEIAPP
jgi:UPF0271 protein